MIGTLVRVDTGLSFVERAELVSNADGSVSFLLDNGLYAGQSPWVVGISPSAYGVRHPDSAVCGAYQRATRTGNAVTFLTRPQDIPCGYLLFLGPTY